MDNIMDKDCICRNPDTKRCSCENIPNKYFKWSLLRRCIDGETFKCLFKKKYDAATMPKMKTPKSSIINMNTDPPIDKVPHDPSKGPT